MTVQTSTNVASFNGDGANKVFPIGYKFNSAADLVVTLIDDEAKTTQILTLNSDFTVTGAGDEEGGVVTLVVAPTAVQRLKVTRVVDILQLTDLRNQGKFYAEIHEDVFDLLIMIDQQQQTEIDDANAKSDEAVATANEANAKSDQAVAKADQNLVNMQAQYDAFEQGAALYVIGDYAAGLVISAYNQIFRKDGEFYRAAAGLDLPYTLTGNWATESVKFVSVGDDVLRQELAATNGAAMIGQGAVSVDTIAGLLAFPVRRADLSYSVSSYLDGWAAESTYLGPTGGGTFKWLPDSTLTIDDGLVIGDAGSSAGRFVRVLTDGEPITTDMFGAPKDGASLAFPKIQAAKAAGERTGKKVVVNNGTYSMEGNPIIFDKAMEFVGESKEGVRFNWSNALAATVGAISVGKNADVVGVRIGGFRCFGSGTGRGLDTGASLLINCKDSLFEDMRFENFSVGLRQTYSWCNTLKNIRFHNCAKPFEFASQVNASHYDTLSFTTFTQTGTFSNCEGIHFTSPNIANFTGATNGIGFTLYQSSVTMDQPYFENPSPVVAQVGSNSEGAIKSILQCSGGIGNPSEFRYASGSSIDISGLRITGPVTLNTADVVSPVAVAGGVTRFEATGVARPSKTPLLNVTAARVPVLAGAFGGSALTYDLRREYLVVSQATANNGIMVASDLVIGQQYTLVAEVRRVGGIPVSANNGTALALSEDAIPLSDNPFIQSRFIFVATAATLRWLFTGSLQIRSLKLFSGIVTDTPIEEIPTLWAGPAAPVAGTWKVGDRVDNSVPAAGGVAGWVCTVAGSPGTWKSIGSVAA